ncbi:unnamed protein product, partial [Amoebophrya sp. A120]
STGAEWWRLPHDTVDKFLPTLVAHNPWAVARRVSKCLTAMGSTQDHGKSDTTKILNEKTR